jgi:hypothetical protein
MSEERDSAETDPGAPPRPSADQEKEQFSAGQLASAAHSDAEHCPQCGRAMQSHRCKLVCECGYFMSCSEF